MDFPGLKPLGPFTIAIDWNPTPHENTCQAEPCPVCLACSTCMDFHSYSGNGCTDENCPLLKQG